MARIQALTFDVGYTLFNDKALVRGALPAVYRWLCEQGMKHSEEHFTARYYHFDRAIDDPSFSHTYGEVAIWTPVLEDLGLAEIQAQSLLDHYRQHLLAQLKDSEQELKALKWAKEQGYRLGLLTNERTVRINTFIDHAGFRPHLDSIVISEERGIGKPDLRFFRFALEELQVPPETVIHFGDNEITDGACKELGIKFVLVTGYKDFEHTWGEGKAIAPDREIEYITPQSLGETIEALDGSSR